MTERLRQISPTNFGIQLSPRRSKWFSHNHDYNHTGSDRNPKHPIDLAPGALGLFTQCEGYQVIFRIKSVEIYDSRQEDLCFGEEQGWRDEDVGDDEEPLGIENGVEIRFHWLPATSTLRTSGNLQQKITLRAELLHFRLCSWV